MKLKIVPLYARVGFFLLGMGIGFFVATLPPITAWDMRDFTHTPAQLLVGGVVHGLIALALLIGLSRGWAIVCKQEGLTVSMLILGYGILTGCHIVGLYMMSSTHPIGSSAGIIYFGPVMGITGWYIAQTIVSGARTS